MPPAAEESNTRSNCTALNVEMLMAQVWDYKWETVKQIPGGGQGETFIVKERDSPRRPGVLKKLKNNKNTQARGRMKAEVAALQVMAASSEAVSRVLDHNTDQFEERVQLYVVTEFIPGQTIRELVDSDGRMSIEDASGLIFAICKTITHGHTDGILHRDLKPENVIVRDLAIDDVVILDYGLSFNSEDHDDLTETDETFRNKFIVLPETTAPGGNRRDPRSDVTAICGLLYYLLTSHVPGPLLDGSGEMPHRRAGFSIRDALPDSADLDQLEILFDSGLAQNVNARFQTVDEFVSRLEGVLRRDDDAIEDPSEVARQEYAALQRVDRTTQLAQLRKFADPFLKAVPVVIHDLAHNFSGFKCTYMGENELKRDALPDGIEQISSTRYRFQLNVEAHKDLCLFVVCIGVRGSQCVLMTRRYERPDGQSKYVASEEWR